MKKYKYIIFWFFAAVVMPFCTCAQVKSTYDKKQVFDPRFFTNSSNETRNANGTPGSKYWQNRADYIIHAALLEKDTTVNGTVNINYTNNSPDTLNYLWLQLDQNLFRSDSRGTAATSVNGDRYDVGKYTNGYKIGEVSVNYMGKNYKIEPVISDTRMQLRLPFIVKPHGDKVS